MVVIGFSGFVSVFMKVEYMCKRGSCGFVILAGSEECPVLASSTGLNVPKSQLFPTDCFTETLYAFGFAV